MSHRYFLKDQYRPVCAVLGGTGVSTGRVQLRAACALVLPVRTPAIPHGQPQCKRGWRATCLKRAILAFLARARAGTVAAWRSFFTCQGA